MADPLATGETWPEALIRMEDERDAALLEVERLTQLLDNGEVMLAAARAGRDKAVKRANELEDDLGDARLDAVGHRLEVARLCGRIADVRRIVRLASEAANDYAGAGAPDIARAMAVFADGISAVLNSVAAGGGATPGDPPAATVTRLIALAGRTTGVDQSQLLVDLYERTSALREEGNLT